MSKTFKRWFRGWLHIAGSEGTRHLFTRLGRLQQHNYLELVNENDKLRGLMEQRAEETAAALAEHKEQTKKIWRAMRRAS